MEFSRSNIPAPFAGRKTRIKPDLPAKNKIKKSVYTNEIKKAAGDEDQLPLSFSPPPPESRKEDQNLIDMLKKLIHELIMLNTQNGTYTKIKFKSAPVEKTTVIKKTDLIPSGEKRPETKRTPPSSIRILKEDKKISGPSYIPHEVMRRSFRNPNFYSRSFGTGTSSETVENGSTGFDLVIENNTENTAPEEES
ncbi:hypothetical protein ACFL6O_02510 [candidate division KSB1 bacterium]